MFKLDQLIIAQSSNNTHIRPKTSGHHIFTPFYILPGLYLLVTQLKKWSGQLSAGSGRLLRFHGHGLILAHESFALLVMPCMSISTMKTFLPLASSSALWLVRLYVSLRHPFCRAPCRQRASKIKLLGLV